MILQRLTLINFKNIPSVTLDFAPGINCFVGNNGAGKTNVLDAIWYLSFCRNPRSVPDSETIRHGEEYFVVQGDYIDNEGEHLSVHCGMKIKERKHFSRNKKEYRRFSDHIGLIPTIAVTPWDLRLIYGGTDERRNFIDTVISQYDKSYLLSLSRYGKALQQRNVLLRAETEPADLDMFDILEEQMAQEGERIFTARESFLQRLLPLFKNYYHIISSINEDINVEYISQCRCDSLLDVIRNGRAQDRIMGYSLRGIHRDDLFFSIKGKPLRYEASQGQSKTFVIALRLAQYDMLKQLSNDTSPLLLLDDIIDKLDMQRVTNIVKLVAENFGQTFITDTNHDRLSAMLRSNAPNNRLFYVSNGEITPANV